LLLATEAKSMTLDELVASFPHQAMRRRGVPIEAELRSTDREDAA